MHKFTKLHTLLADDCDINTIGMQEIAKCTNLKELSCWHDPRSWERMEFSYFHQMPLLENLKAGNLINDTDIEKMTTACPHLKQVSLYNGDAMTDSGLADLAKLPLRVLKLFFKTHRRQINVTNEGLSKLAENCHTLEILVLHYASSITLEGIKSVLKSNPRLHTLDLKGCKLIKDEDLLKAIPEGSNINSVNGYKDKDVVQCKTS